MNKIEKNCTVNGMYSPDDLAEGFFKVKNLLNNKEEK